MTMFPQLLREAGYYGTNNAKEDYNLDKPGQVWDDSVDQGHWRNRKPGQPFFAVFNLESPREPDPHAGRTRGCTTPPRCACPPTTPTRPRCARTGRSTTTSITEMDAGGGAAPAELEADGLADDTIVFYWADHGSGMPRSKRWPYDSGLHVPLIVSHPDEVPAPCAAGLPAGRRSRIAWSASSISRRRC